MLFQRKIDGAMKKLHEGSDAAEEERRKEAGEPYEEMERPELEKGDIPAMIIAAFITFIPVAILVLGIVSRKRNKRNSAAGKRNGRGN